MSSPNRSYLGASAADRVAARRRKLVEVGFERMASDGWSNVTIDLLCKTAKLNKRYFYESFPDLDALAAAVVDELSAELVARGTAAATEAAVRSFDTRAFTRHTLTAVIGHLMDDPRRALVLFREVHRSPSAERHRRDTIRGLSPMLSAYAHEHHRAHAAQPIAEVASTLLIGGTVEVILAAIDGHIVRTREQLVEDVATLWLAIGDGAARAAVEAGRGTRRKRQDDASD